MGRDISRDEAIAMVKAAIVRCHLSDLPKTRESMVVLLQTLNVTSGKHGPEEQTTGLLH